ncbi:MAG: hypothetical protein ACD_9C00076G0003 [uncultured bacterium]|nr:MAG: hypothetical protein ACD_9C00076G0003 [uncultured bacterium]
MKKTFNDFRSNLPAFFIKYVKKLRNFFCNKKRPTVLAVVNHYYGKGKDFRGKSGTQDASVRKGIVEKVINELRKIPNTEIRICGIKEKSLVSIDQDFSHVGNPSFLIYESIEWMASQVDKYDYFINIEDDILLTRKTFERIVEFDKENKISECFHPNRMECDGSHEYCVDLKAWPGWTNVSKKYNNYDLRIAENPHSGIAVLSKEKLKYAVEKIDLKRRDKIIGHYMASAYANLHSPFLLFRNFSDLSAHKVIHLDNWDPR